MDESSLILDFALQEVTRSCEGLKRRCTHCCMGIIGAGEGATHMRAVGVDEPAAGGTWMWAGARPAPAAGAGCLCWLVSTTLASASAAALPVFGRMRPHRPLMCARAGRGPRPHLPGLQTLSSINEHYLAPLYLQTAQLFECSENLNGSVQAAFQLDFRAKTSISGQLHHGFLFFLIITIIITYIFVITLLLLHYSLLLRQNFLQYYSLLHVYYLIMTQYYLGHYIIITYYYQLIITYYYGNNRSIITHYY